MRSLKVLNCCQWMFLAASSRDNWRTKVWEYFDYKDKNGWRTKNWSSYPWSKQRRKVWYHRANQGNGRIDGPTVNSTSIRLANRGRQFTWSSSRILRRTNSTLWSDSWWKSHLRYGKRATKRVWPQPKMNTKEIEQKSTFKGKWVGEWVKNAWGRSHRGRIGRYYGNPIKVANKRMDAGRFWGWIPCKG